MKCIDCFTRVGPCPITRSCDGGLGFLRAAGCVRVGDSARPCILSVVCLPVCQFVCLSICLTVHLSAFLLFGLFTCPSVYLSASLFTRCPFAYLSVCVAPSLGFCLRWQSRCFCLFLALPLLLSEDPFFPFFVTEPEELLRCPGRILFFGGCFCCRGDRSYAPPLL